MESETESDMSSPEVSGKCPNVRGHGKKVEDRNASVECITAHAVIVVGARRFSDTNISSIFVSMIFIAPN